MDNNEVKRFFDILGRVRWGRQERGGAPILSLPPPLFHDPRYAPAGADRSILLAVQTRGKVFGIVTICIDVLDIYQIELVVLGQHPAKILDPEYDTLL